MTQEAEPFRIAIIGGGIGGLYAALSIRHHCKNESALIDVYEQASDFREIGAGVGIGVNAARLIHAIGLGERMNAMAGFRNGTWINFRRADTGGPIVEIPLDDSQEIRQAPIARTDILDLFKGAVEERQAATMHTKKRFQQLRDHGDYVMLRFEDSTEVEAHLVIGCDGIHSRVRDHFYDDKPVYSGQIAYRAVIPTAQIDEWWPFTSFSAMWCGKGKHFLTFPISGNKELNIVAFANARAKDAEKVAESWVSTCKRKDVQEDYADFAEPVQRMIALMPDEPSKWRINDREPLDEWGYMNGKVMLLGDAAHAMLPHLGAGAGQSIEDGWILGRVLGEFFDVQKRLQSLEVCARLYQAVRLPRAQKVQATSRTQGATYDMQSEDMVGKDYGECTKIIADRLRDRMNFVWEVDLDKAYKQVRDEFMRSED